ncbi:MAG TPA: hypothetical protein VHS76_04800 [Steroidobacteraceae bacterium]|nr:hypothetical protein [Steroidobacteraceae bacterium]
MTVPLETSVANSARNASAEARDSVFVATGVDSIGLGGAAGLVGVSGALAEAAGLLGVSGGLAATAGLLGGSGGLVETAGLAGVSGGLAEAADLLGASTGLLEAAGCAGATVFGEDAVFAGTDSFSLPGADATFAIVVLY